VTGAGRLRVTDSQVHLFPASSQASARAFGHRVIEPAELIKEMDQAAVSRAILIPPRVTGATNEDARTIAIRWPERLRVVGKIAPEPASWRPEALQWQASSLLGLRISFPPSAPGPAEASSHELWRTTEAAGIPMMVWSPGRLHEVRQVARRYPALKIAVDHCGLGPDDHGAGVMRVMPELRQLAACPNISVKVSALPAHSSGEYPFADLHGLIAGVAGCFGPRRMFWGSDLSGLGCSYTEAVNMFTEGLTCLTDEDLEWVMGQSISEWLNWPD
jgi:L-fuconolactonase